MTISLIAALEEIEEASLGGDRLRTLKKHDSAALRGLLLYSLDPSTTFGIKKIPPPSAPGVASMSDADWWPLLVSDILIPLSERTLSGNKAKQAISSFLGLCSPTEVKWTERILKQDLRLGIGAKDVNKVLPGTIP